MSKPTNKNTRSSSKRLAAKNAGIEGENFVAELLKANGWEIVATQWRCYWGELDVVVRDRTWLVFVEVKTRSVNNWDENGLLAIALSKQKKLWQAATEFLACHPDLAKLHCRFDVALVKNSPPNHLELHDYLESAFSL